MKTARTIAAIAKATRELEKRTKKTAGPEFAQVLVAATAPMPLPVAAKPAAPVAQARTVEQIALHAKKPLPVPAPKAKAERAPEQVELPSVAAPSLPTSNARAVAEPPPASFVAALPEDPALRLTVNPNVAAIQVQTPDAGDLSLYLRVRQGAAELRVDGAAAPVLERRVDELKRVLAAEGISLRHVEVTPPSEAQQTATFSSDSEHGQRHAPPEPVEAPEAPVAAAKTAPSTPARVEAGLHVRA